MSDSIKICYNKRHDAISDGPTKIEKVNLQYKASKLLRTVLRNTDGLQVEEWKDYSIHKCDCGSDTENGDDQLDSLDLHLRLEDLGIKDGDTVFVRRKEKGMGGRQVQESESLEEISKKRALSDQLEQSSSKRQKPETPLSLAQAQAQAQGRLDSALRKRCNTISSILGGSGWKTQSIGTLGSLPRRNHTSFVLAEKAINASLRHPSSSKEPRNGLFPAVFIKANAIRVYKIENGTLKGRTSLDWDQLSRADFRLATSLLKSKSEKSLVLSEEEESALTELTALRGGEDFTSTLPSLGVTSAYMKPATEICQCWRNSDWISQPPTGYKSTVGLNQYYSLLKLAMETKVKRNEVTPKGFPELAMKALQKAISVHYSRPKSSNGGSKSDWAQCPCLELATELVKQGQVESCEVSSTSSSPSSQERTFPSSSSSLASAPELRQDPSTSRISLTSQPHQDSSLVVQTQLRSHLSSFQGSISDAGLSRRKETELRACLKEMREILDRDD